MTAEGRPKKRSGGPQTAAPQEIRKLSIYRPPAAVDLSKGEGTSAGLRAGSSGPAPTDSGPSAGAAGSFTLSIAGFVPLAYISRRVVRLLAVWVEEQAVKKATVSKQAAILVIIFFEFGKA